MSEFVQISKELVSLVDEWEPKLQNLDETVICERYNSQNRTIKQILGHMVDSASNNIHRIVHLQYQESPLLFPDYANLGNNDRWISIQDYQSENWNDLIQLWKYINIHIAHVITHVSDDQLDNVWISALNQKISLKAMIKDFPRHFKLHLDEIEELIHQ
jgi:hypothetical protein